MTSQANPLELHNFPLHEFKPLSDDSSYQLVLNEDTEEGRVNGEPNVEDGEHFSECSSVNGSIEIEMPSDIPDGPKFDDLAVYVDVVVASIKAREEKSIELAVDVSTKSPISLDNQCGTCNILTDDDFEEFASFATFENAVVGPDVWATEYDKCRQDGHNCDTVQSEWPDGSSLAPKFSEDSDGEEFGDFESSALHKEPNSGDDVPSDRLSIGILERLLSHLEPALGRAFPASDGNDWLADGKSMDEPNDMESAYSPTVIHSPCKVNRPSLFPKVFSLHRTHDYRFHWSKSPIYDAYLQSLHVDPRSAMPAFASQLRLLEPVRLDAVSRSPSDVQTSKPSTFPSTLRPSTSSSETDTTRSSTTASSAEAPEFDWNSSGLINPLQAITIDPVQLGLDFFELQQQQAHRQSNHSSAETNTVTELERELFSQVSAPPSNATPQLTVPGIITQSSTISALSERSKNVREALMKIPKLTYMRAKCLMFPVAEEKPT